MSTLEDQKDPVSFFDLSPEATHVAGQVFTACTKKLGVDGDRIFRSFVETGSFKAALGVSEATIEALYGRAHQQFALGRYDRAEEIFRTLCTLDKSRSDFWLGLGICYRARGKNDAALKMFEHAAAVSPSDAIPHFHRFDVAMRRSDLDAAVEACAAFERNSDGTEHENVIRSFQKLKTALEMHQSG